MVDGTDRQPCDCVTKSTTKWISGGVRGIHRGGEGEVNDGARVSFNYESSDRDELSLAEFRNPARAVLLIQINGDKQIERRGEKRDGGATGTEDLELQRERPTVITEHDTLSWQLQAAGSAVPFVDYVKRPLRFEKSNANPESAVAPC